MAIRALVELDYGNEAELLSLSDTGMIDLDSSYAGEGHSGLSRERAFQAFGKDASRRALGLPCPTPDADTFYELTEFSPSRVRASLFSPYPSAAIEGPALEFLWRYKSAKAFALVGDYARAAIEIEEFAGAEAYASLLRHSLGEGAFLMIALRYLTSFDEGKQAKLASLLSDEPEDYKGPDRSDYLRLYYVAAPLIESKDAFDFVKEAGRRIASFMRAGSGLVAPVVGCCHTMILDDFCELVRRASREGLRRSLVEGLAGYEERIEAYVRGAKGKVAREPWNEADRNALMVTLWARGLKEAKAGYLRRDLARALAPFALEAGHFDARLVRLGREGIDIELRLPERQETLEAT